MDKKFQFTKKRIGDLIPPKSGRVDYYDMKEPKLTCRVSSTGNKSFVVLAWDRQSMKRITVGKFPGISVDGARKKAKAILTSLNAGIDPIAEKRKEKTESTKLVDVLEMYLAERDLKPYTVKNYRYKLKLGFKDWLNKPISSITEDMILKRHKKISQTGKTTANTTMRVLRLVMNYAHAVDMIDSVPTDILRKARLWHKNNRKNIVIHSTKLKVWHEAVEALPNEKAKVYLLMMLYMGFRSGEVLTLEWSSIDMDEKTILLLDTKNRTDRTFPIPSPLLPYLSSLHRLTGSHRWVFAGKNPDKHMAEPIKPIQAVIKASSVTFSPHVCRHTFATIAEAVNLPLSMIKRLMNHTTSNDVTGGYIHTEEDTLRTAINQIGNYIQARVTQKDNVIKLQNRRQT